MANNAQTSQFTSFQTSTCETCQKDCCLLRNVHIPADSYGGNQDWFEEVSNDSYSALRGCGIIALLNQFASLAMAYPEAQALLPEAGLPTTKQEFVEWAYTVRPYIWPGNFGLPKGKGIRDGAVKYAQDRGVSLTWKTVFGRPSLQEEIDFIHSGLEHKVPVAQLAWKSYFEDLTWHWVAITGLELDPKNCSNLTPELKDKHKGDLFVTMSNFGKKEAYPITLMRKENPFHREMQYPLLAGI